MSDIYIGAGNFLKKLTGDGEEVWSYTYDAAITGLVEGGDDNLYVTGGNNPTHVVNKSGQLIKEVSELRGYLNKDYRGNIYGLNAAQGGSNTIHRYNISLGAIDMSTVSSFPNLNSMQIDDEGNIYAARYLTSAPIISWVVGYDNNGDVFLESEKTSNGYRSGFLVLDSEGYVWTGEPGYQFTKYDPRTGARLITKQYDSAVPLKKQMVTDNKKRYIYMGTTGLMYKIDALNSSFTRIDPANCHSLAKDKNDYLYTGSNDGFLRKYDPDDALVWEKAIGESGITSIVASEDNYCFQGTAKKGAEPVAGAKVTLIRSIMSPEAPNSHRVRYTDSNGQYQFNGLIPDEEYHLCCEYEDAEGKYNSLSYPFVRPAKEGAV